MIKFCLIFLAISGVQGCGWFSDPEIIVRNAGGVAVYNVKLEVGGGTIEVGSISVGESRKVNPKVVMDSSLLVLYVENGKDFVCRGDVYFTNNLYVKVEADVGGGVCRVREVLR
ncbi:hypothetical protein [Stenotrophomonas sp. NA06056]|uniref:hypothetical protein n=1 Tax=Stenotrophomonas sp. NA06056 TaxID=2742129 RepID=UPI00158BBC54|nr:hypothetical protein [Stenotrophomonas sp. NA06056]QKW57715.1 hypothetical protein HUT07_14310 [Stenotrophomonas sp. NA06056]